MSKIREIMSPYVETIRAGDSVKHAAGRMRAFDIGSLLVLEEGELVGIVTDRDVVVRALAAGKDPETTAVSEIMSPEIICCNQDQEIEEVTRMMEINQLRRLPLVDSDGCPCGIVTVGDLARSGYEGRAARIILSIAQSVPAVSGSPWFR